MKLTRCYIENFGTLHGFEMSFEGGVTVIKAPNGFGKTTFAAFIRAMLYGFPRGNRSNLEKDHRRKYSPWQGGRFGGCLEFELKGKGYRLERFFGDTPSRDSFALYELPSLRPCKDFSENLGVEIFGLDADSFERSTYMSRLAETAALSTDMIQAKLSNLVEDTGDVNNYEKAIANLRKARTKLLPYRGTGGEVYHASEKITALQTELEQINSAKARLPALYTEIATLERRIEGINAETESLQKELFSASEQAKVAALIRERRALVRRCEELKVELEAYSAERQSSGNNEPEKEAKEPEIIGRSRVLTVFLIIAALFALGGIAVAILVDYVLGGVIFAVGLLAATTGIYIHFKKLAEELEEKKSTEPEDDIEDLLREYEIRADEKEKRLAAALNELDEFDAAHPEICDTELLNSTDSAELKERFEELGRRLTELSRRLAEKRREAALLREQADRMGETEAALEHWREVRLRGIKTAEELDKTAEFLRSARESLSTGYMERIEGGFAAYMSCLSEDETGRYFVDSDLSVSLERGGEARRLEQFSAGFSDIVMLCMRLALIDALFEGEKPFIIMDDPFVNLDDEHTKNALELVKKLGGERQIIYLVCNSSRC